MRKISSMLLMFLLCSVCIAQPIVKPSFIIPTDEKPLYQHEMDVILEDIAEVQAFYASEMQRLGYGQKTFEFDTHMPLYIGNQTAKEYKDYNQVRALGIPTDNADDILLVFLVGVSSIDINGPDPAAGVYQGTCIRDECEKYGIASIAYKNSATHRKATIAHELGHAFGFPGHQAKLGTMMYATASGTGSLDDIEIHPDTAKMINKSNVLYVQDGIVPIEPPDGSATPNNNYDVPHLVAYYPFDGNADDASGNGNHGQSIGSINYVDGKFGKALELSTGEYIEMKATDTLHSDIFKAEPFTLSAWTYPEMSTAFGHIWRSRSPANAGHTLFIMGDGSISWRAMINGQWSWDELCETKRGHGKANEWMHVAVTNDGNKIRIYANGDLAAETDFQETDGRNTIYSIGSRYPITYQEAFAGWIDDFAIFSRALSEGEIKRIIQVGVKQFNDSLNDNSDMNADVNDDGYVDIYDVMIVRSGMSAKSTYDTDINNDGVTDEVDLAIVKGAAHAAIAAASPRKRKVNITTWGSLKRR